MPSMAPPGMAPHPLIGLDAFHTAGPPEAEPHLGHARSPCVRRTFSATLICSSREAVDGEPMPAEREALSAIVGILSAINRNRVRLQSEQRSALIGIRFAHDLSD